MLKNNFAAQAVLFAACAMCKLRKIVFSVLHPQFADQNWHYKVVGMGDPVLVGPVGVLRGLYTAQTA